MRRIKILCIGLILVQSLNAQEEQFIEKEVKIPTSTETIQGNYLNPDNVEQAPLVILIPGSGPTDRDGNNASLKNNSLKYLAEQLAEKGIASYRYDKSVLTFGADAQTNVEALRFETFIEECRQVIAYFREKEYHQKIVVAGHSQGALVGMIAGRELADGYISLAGAGRPIGTILVEQIEKQAPFLKAETERVVALLEKGEFVDEFDPNLVSLFNRSIQPFLISWMKYDPRIEIAKLKIPTMIIIGSKDIQVPMLDAEELSAAFPEASLHIVENMNHLFKNIPGDINENMASYNNPELPVMTELTTLIASFSNSL
jgi:pimeloyl-ACP methyl ester carboxylesterase